MATSAMETKKILRKSIGSVLKNLEADYLMKSSTSCINQVINLPVYQNCKSISIYLSMPKELQTLNLLKHSFDHGKKVYIPKIIGPHPEDMIMLELYSYDEIESFPKNNWGIPEPQIDHDLYRSLPIPAVDVVIVPGVAFGEGNCRLGHGKGYYDCFLARLQADNVKMGRQSTTTIGLALDEQIVDGIPVSEHDVLLDYVVSASKTAAR